MKKLLLIPILLASLFLCACQSSDEVDYTSQLRLNITHIDESDDAKEIHISYPVFGGIDNKEAITIINTSISNFVNSQYDEFQNALTAKEQDALSDTEDLLNPNADNDADNDSDTDTDNDSDNDSDTDSDSDTEDESDTTEGSSGKGNEGDSTDDKESENTKSTEKNSDRISLSMTFKITYNKNNYLCIVQTYEKNLGEDKDFNEQRSFLFSLENAAYLSLGEIFNFDEEFTTYMNDKIKKDLANGAYATYDDNSGFSGISKNSKFYIDNNNLYIFYDTLEISPDKDTIPTFAFKISDVKPYVNEEFANIF